MMKYCYFCSVYHNYIYKMKQFSIAVCIMLLVLVVI